MKKMLCIHYLKGNRSYKYQEEIKKIVRIIGLILIIAGITGCRNNNGNDVSNTPTPVNTGIGETADNQTTPGEEGGPESQDTGDSGETLTIQDYYPFRENTVYRYAGEGNEFASFDTYTDYTEGNRIQLRSNNGGSESVRVLELKDGELIKVLSRGECYYRENLMEQPQEESEILLKEPLIQGTEWTLKDNSKRYISDTDAKITTPSGSYQALEVTTEGDGNTTVDYYVRDVGLVKTVFTSSGSEITSSLSKIEENVPFKQNVRFFYPDGDKDVIYSEKKEIAFDTNDVTGSRLEAAIKEITRENYEPVLSVNTRLNSLYLNQDNVVYADFSKELVSEMNAGAGYEARILQCIANTLGTYYGVDKVSITVEGKPYESGHILMKKGETIDVNLDKAWDTEQ